MYLSRHTKFVAIPQHLIGLGGIAYYLFYLGHWGHLLWTYIAWVIMGVFGVTLVYHKIYAHRSFEPNVFFKPFMYFLTLAGMMTGQGSPISYSAVHRYYHHKFSDISHKDPHSPRQHGFWQAYYGWHFRPTYFKLTSVRDLLSNKFLLWCHKHYYTFFVSVLVISAFINFEFTFFCLVLPGLIHVHEMNILNSFSHSRKFGYRNYETEDDSVNNFVFGILTFGTGFHNNHHAFPERWHNQVRWFEFDPFRWIVPLIMKK